MYDWDREGDFVDHGDPRVDTMWRRLLSRGRRPVHGGYPGDVSSGVPSDADGTLLEEFYRTVPAARTLF